MGPFNGPVFAFALCLCLKTSFAYTEAVGANVGVGDKFVPQVAFICNKPAMHRSVNGWEPDFKTDCVNDADKILEYCQKLYPNHDIRNVMEMGTKVNIPDWPRFDGPDPDNHEVFPFKCQVGEFESEALLVPQHCEFDHKHDSSRCEHPSNWTRTAAAECADRKMNLQSSSMLVECGTNAFRGVEYVCCPPKDKEETPIKPTDEDDMSDEYRAYLRGDDMTQYNNEHKKFKAAEKAMMKHQHEKITKMMKEWQEAREHVAQMRKSNKKGAEQLNKEITERFQRMYHAYEQEGLSEKKQLVALHQQRVQAMFNRRKNMLMKAYTQELETEDPKTAKILNFLKQYIRVEEKDRLHSVNHYEHLRDTDPEEALKIRDNTINHMSQITQRIEDTIAKLDRVPELAKDIKPVIAEFRNKRFRNIEISVEEVVLKPVDKPVNTVIEHKTLVGKQEEIDNKIEDDHDYTNIRIDSEGLEEENTPLVAHAQNNGMHVQQASFTEKQSVRYTATNVVGIAIGSVAVFIIIVVAVVMLRKRSRRQPITHGFVEVDPAASPEERHVANMQMNGYENPTYRYFEMSK